MSSILHLISSSGVYGAESVLLELAEYTRSLGDEVTIGIFHNRHRPNLDLAAAAKRRGLAVRVFECDGKYDTSTVRSIRKYLGDEGVKVLHSHNYKSNMYALRSRTPEVKWVVTNHGRRKGLRLAVYGALNCAVIMKADKVVAVSDQIARSMARSGIQKRRIALVENGVNADSFAQKPKSEARRRLGIKRDGPVVGTVGSLTTEKGHEYLLQAMRNLRSLFPSALCVIIGDGVEKERLARITEELGLGDTVIFAGIREDVPTLLASFDVFAFPSLREGLPMAVLEALAARVPVSASAVGGIPSAVIHGETGLLVPPRSPEALGEALGRLLSNREEASCMAEKGRALVEERFSTRAMGLKYHNLYNELMASPN